MRTCYIIGAAPIVNYHAFHLQKSSSDIVICADGGYCHAEKLSLQPDWLVGDFDSQTEGVAPNVIRVKPEKDDTDLQLALEQGIALGFESFVLVGVSGGRLDHSIAAIQLLVWMVNQGYRCEILDEQNRLTALCPGTHRIAKEGYYYLSLFSYQPTCSGLTLNGMKYPLQNASLQNTYPLGVSNEIVGEYGEIEFDEGMLLLVQSC